MTDFLISGYYGFKNNGDDALLLAMIAEITEKNPNAKIKVLSKNPKETRKIYNVTSVNRYNPFSLIFSMIFCKVFINGGGSLMQDVTSTKSLYYYLYTIKLALFFGKKVMLYANGIGPINKEKNRKLAAKILNHVDVITLRERSSAMELKKMQVTKPKIYITADPAFNLPISKCNLNLDKYSVISIRSWKNYDEKIINSVAESINNIWKKHAITPVFMPMQYQFDVKITNAVAGKLTVPYVILENKYKIDELLGIINDCQYVVGMRLHALIYGARCGKKSVGIIYDPKVQSFMEYVNQQNMVDLQDISAEKLVEAMENCLLPSAEIDVGKFCNLAKKNADIAVKLAK